MSITKLNHCTPVVGYKSVFNTGGYIDKACTNETAEKAGGKKGSTYDVEKEREAEAEAEKRGNNKK